MIKISEMNLANPLTGVELVEVVQDGINKRSTVNQLFTANKTAYELAVVNGFIGTQKEWLSSLRGPQGERGLKGLSAYEIAKLNGYMGSQVDWLISIDSSSSEVISELLEIVRVSQEKLDAALALMHGATGVKRFTFTSSLTWLVEHNANSVNFIETLQNANNERIYANINIIDSNSFLIQFTEPEEGSVNVVFYVNA